MIGGWYLIHRTVSIVDRSGKRVPLGSWDSLAENGLIGVLGEVILNGF